MNRERINRKRWRLGAAMLLALPARRQEQVIAANLKQTEAFGAARLRGVHAMLRRSRRHGYGINLADVVPGIHAFGMPLFHPSGGVFASLGLAAAAQAFARGRVAEVEELLRAEARRIERDCAAEIAALGV